MQENKKTRTSKLTVDPLGGKHEARWRERKKRNLDKEISKQKHDKQSRGRTQKVGMDMKENDSPKKEQ